MRSGRIFFIYAYANSDTILLPPHHTAFCVLLQWPQEGREYQ